MAAILEPPHSGLEGPVTNLLSGEPPSERLTRTAGTQLMTVGLAGLLNVRTEPLSLRQLCVKSAEAFWLPASFAMCVGNCTQHSALGSHLAPWPRTPSPHPREVAAAIYFLRGGTNAALRFCVKRRTGDGDVSPRNHSVLPAVRRPLPRNRSEAIGSRGQNCAT